MLHDSNTLKAWVHLSTNIMITDIIKKHKGQNIYKVGTTLYKTSISRMSLWLSKETIMKKS